MVGLGEERGGGRRGMGPAMIKIDNIRSKHHV